jgi:galactokinase/galacturonokinase
VLGRTIPAGTLLLYAPQDEPAVRLASTRFPGQAAFPIGAPVEPGHWARYAQAAALALGRTFKLRHGFSGVVNGSLVAAGLASSASVGLAYLQVLAGANGITLSRAQLIDLNLALERTFLGLENGIQDQSAILHGTDESLVLTDTRRRQATLIADPPAAAGAAWLIVYSGVSRELTLGGDFNQRVGECRQAARWLHPEAEILSDVPEAEYERRAQGMPENLRLRAAHFFSEVGRVKAGAQAWQTGDLERFGDLMNRSCESSIHKYQSAAEPIISLQRIVRQAPGVYGGRFSGGGGGGCVVALVARDRMEQAASQILSRYRQRYPRHGRSAAAFDGSGPLRV